MHINLGDMKIQAVTLTIVMANNVCMHMQEKEQYKSMTNFPDNKKSDKIDSIEID